MKTKNETLNFVKTIIIDLKNNYDYSDVVIDKIIQHIVYQEDVYHENKT